MRSALFVVFAAALAGVQAQLDAIPDCALSCLLGGILESGCDIGDYKCSCSNQAFIDSSAECILASCSEADVQLAKDATRQLCRDAGVEITFPDE